MAPMLCDRCGAPGKYLVGDMDTGEQTVLCVEHGNYAAGPDAPPTAVGVCENCSANPAEFILTSVGDGSRIPVCGSCYLVLGRLAYDAAPAELQRAVDEIAGTGSPRPAARRRGRAAHDDASPLRVVDDAEAGGVDDAGTGDGVAVDGAGASQETPPGAEPEPAADAATAE